MRGGCGRRSDQSVTQSAVREGRTPGECFQVHFPGDRTDDAATVTSEPGIGLRGAIRPQLLQRPGLRTAVDLPTEAMTIGSVVGLTR
jgi:hypothetical protein